MADKQRVKLSLGQKMSRGFKFTYYSTIIVASSIGMGIFILQIAMATGWRTLAISQLILFTLEMFLLGALHSRWRELVNMAADFGNVIEQAADKIDKVTTNDGPSK